MRLLGELEPTKNPDKLALRVEKLAQAVDAIDIPEAPMGRPIASAAVLAAYIKAKYFIDVVPHVRIVDVNTVGLLSILGGLRAAGVEEAVLLRGDRPALGGTVEELTVEEAASIAAKRLHGSPRLGAMLSLRYPMEAIRSRLEAPLSFYLVLRANYSIERLAEVSKLARSLGKTLYPYVIVASKKNYEKLKMMLADQPIYSLDEAIRFAEKVKSYVDGLLISSPGDMDTVAEAAREIKRRLGLPRG
ncbi:hypothetical protein CF15_05530 [Pyrodictium occultum]|uniref:Methylenetetrahydrofolate reductase (NAD(P)H) n=1 Tax=Pyrodictium occultum TaxID=2309 RepID=A0A0V8RVX1_PYROC|nr:hypothetical protein [Pyrodictium occultum]KSW12217.1 hypothetical protein CF15_05530 [Pyrodictium occultum]